MLLIHALACAYSSARALCAHISVSVFVALSRERFFDFPETSLIYFTKFYILSSHKRSSILELKRARSRSLTHRKRERHRERENISRI